MDGKIWGADPGKRRKGYGASAIRGMDGSDTDNRGLSQVHLMRLTSVLEHHCPGQGHQSLTTAGHHYSVVYWMGSLGLGV